MAMEEEWVVECPCTRSRGGEPAGSSSARAGGGECRLLESDSVAALAGCGVVSCA